MQPCSLEQPRGVTQPRTPGDYASCEPIAANVAFCNRLYQQGHTVILHSSRGMDTHSGNAAAAAADVAQATLASLEKLGVMYASAGRKCRA